MTLPTVGTVASQITFPVGFAPDGTTLTIVVSAGGATTSSAGRRATAVATARNATRRPQSIAAPAWSATIGSTVPLYYSGVQATLASPLAAGSSPTEDTLSSYEIVNAQTSGGPMYESLGSVTASSSVGGTVTFGPIASCTPAGGEITQINGVQTGAAGSSSSNGVSTTYTIGSLHTNSTTRSTTTTGAGVCQAPPGTTTAAAPGPGNLYVSDPGSGAVLLFGTGSTGNVAPFVALDSAPSIATDFAGELVTSASAGPGAGGLAIHSYGSAAVVDSIQLGASRATAIGVAADPLGAHVGIVGYIASVSSGKTAASAPSIAVFDRAQGGITDPTSSWSPLDLSSVFDHTFWLDGSDDAFVPGAQESNLCGASEFAPNFGSGAPLIVPYRSVYVNPCGAAQVTLDSANNLYVALPGCCIDVFAPGTGGTAAPTFQLMSPGATNPTSGFNGPSGVAVDGAGNVYVSSPGVYTQNSDGSLSLVAPGAIYVYGPASTWGVSPAPLRVITGSATGLVAPGLLAIVPGTPTTPPTQSIQVAPMAVSFTAAGQSQSLSVTESGFNGSFTQTNTCAGIAGIASVTGGFTVTAQSAGTCFGTIADGTGNTARIGVNVTTTSFSLNAIHRH